MFSGAGLASGVIAAPQAMADPVFAITTEELPFSCLTNGHLGYMDMFGPIILETEGGIPPISWSYSNLAGGASFSLNSATGQISGGGANLGVMTFTITATDSTAQIATKNLSIETRACSTGGILPTISPLLGEVGSAFSYYFGTVAEPPYRFRLYTGELPDGLVLDEMTGQLYGTPTTAETYEFTLRQPSRMWPESWAPTRSFVMTINPAPSPPSPPPSEPPIPPGPDSGQLIVHKFMDPNNSAYAELRNDGSEINWSGVGLPQPEPVPGVEYKAVGVPWFCPDRTPLPGYGAMYLAGDIGTATAEEREVIENFIDDCNIYTYVLPPGGMFGSAEGETNASALAVALEDFLGMPFERRVAWAKFWEEIGYVWRGTTGSVGSTDCYGVIGLEDCHWIGPDHEVGPSGGSEPWPTLPLGLWWVTETWAPAGIKPGTPFAAFLPAPDPDNPGEWLYTVHAYPKNEQRNIWKEIVGDNVDETATVLSGTDVDYFLNAGSIVGDSFNYRITVAIPKLDAGQSFSRFWIKDVIDAKLTPVGWAATPVALDGSALNYGSDWEDLANHALLPELRTYDGDPYCAEPVAGAPVEHSLSESACKAAGYIWLPNSSFAMYLLPNGLTSLSSAAIAQSVSGELQLTIEVRVKANTQGERIPNIATLEYEVIEGSSVIRDETEDSNAVTVSFGGLDIWKHRAGVQSEGLSGAKFELYAGPCSAYDPNDTETLPVDFFAIDPSTPAIGYGTTVGAGLTPPELPSITTASGVGVFGGLAYGKYCLVETTAPEGYNRNSPMDVTIGHQLGDGFTINIPNAPKNAGFPFPITGGGGAMLYAIIAGVILTGTIYSVKKQKRPIVA